MRRKTAMNRPLLKRVLPQVLAWAALVAVGSLIAGAQDTNQTATAGQRTDGQIEMDVVHALDASNALKNDLITAATIQSEVTLSGTVASDASKELAESIAGRVQGVTKVHNNLKVGNPQAEQAAVADSSDQTTDTQPESTASSAATSEQPQAYSQAQEQAQTTPYPQQQSPYAEQPYGSSAQPQYAYSQPSVTPYETPKGPVTIPQGTLLQLRTSEPVSSKNAKDGTPVQFTVIQDVAMGGVLAIPRGATVHGVVTQVKNTNSGQLSGNAELALTLTSLDLAGQSYPLISDEFKVKGPNKAGQTASGALAGGLIGTVIGCAAGRGVGCAIGAGAGVAAGTTAAAASSGPGAWIPAEAKVDFHLAEPVTVVPVSAQEAARLAQGMNPGGPTLYRRGGPGPYVAPYYAYPPVYYRPYYVMGGYYYWR
jgi:hypothetical protein